MEEFAGRQGSPRRTDAARPPTIIADGRAVVLKCYEIISITVAISARSSSEIGAEPAADWAAA